MPTYEHDGGEATRFLVNNEHGRWYKTGIDVSDQAGDFAVQRLKHRLFEPVVASPLAHPCHHRRCRLAAYHDRGHRHGADPRQLCHHHCHRHHCCR